MTGHLRLLVLEYGGRVSSFLMAHQHILGYLVPYDVWKVWIKK